MKKYCLFIAMLAAVLSTSSCTKDEHEGFKGNYTFKTGGYVTLSPVMTQGPAKTLALQPESGQMDILDNGDGGKVLVTMNILAGSAIVVDAVISDGTLTIEPYSRIVTLMQGQNEKYGAMVTVSGTARKMDNMIIFDISYEGYAEIGGYPYMISASNVEQIAKEN